MGLETYLFQERLCSIVEGICYDKVLRRMFSDGATVGTFQLETPGKAKITGREQIYFCTTQSNPRNQESTILRVWGKHLGEKEYDLEPIKWERFPTEGEDYDSFRVSMVYSLKKAVCLLLSVTSESETDEFCVLVDGEGYYNLEKLADVIITAFSGRNPEEET